MAIGESVEVASSRNPENAGRLTPEYASLVFFISFRHSQGIPGCQGDIFSYIHIIRPEWKIAPEDQPKILEGSKEMILAYLFGDEHGRKKGGVALHKSSLTREEVNTAIGTELDLMEEIFNHKEKPKPEKKRELIQGISDSIIETDLYYLVNKDGRERSPESERPLMDPWLSFIVHFGLNGNSTGVPELDEMYRDIRMFVLSGNIPDEMKTRLDKVMKIYRRKHPRVKINLGP